MAILRIITIIAFLIGTGSAALSSQATIEIISNLNDHLTLTVPSSISSWNLNNGPNTVSGTLGVNSNNYWGVNARSDQSDGKMKEFYNNYITGGKSLYNPLHILCTSPVNTDVSLTDQNQPLIPSGQANTQGTTSCSITFSQNVDSVHDTRATAPNRYHIIVTFTAYISY